MAGEAIRPAEIFKQISKSVFVLRRFGIIFAECSLNEKIGLQSGKTVAGAQNKQHLDAVLLDEIIQIGINEIDSRASAPMAQKTRFYVAEFQFPFQQNIIRQIYLGGGNVICGANVSFDLFNGARVVHGLNMLLTSRS